MKKNKLKNRTVSKSLKKILGFRPKSIKYYTLALTHKSAGQKDCVENYENNERLEYLGDAILDAVISELLYLRFPTGDEGFLTQMRTKIVNGKKLSELAKKIGIKKLISVDKGTPLSEKIYEDAFEAFIGAIFLDRGYDYVKRFVTQRIMIHHVNLSKLKHVETNYKSKVIEWSQKNKFPIEFLTDYESEGSKYFVSYLKVDSEVFGTGRGTSKKEAEQNAAEQALKTIELKDQD